MNSREIWVSVHLAPQVVRCYPSPHTREVGFSIGRARRRSGEVGLAVRSAWHSGGRIIQPLGEEHRRSGDNQCGSTNQA